MEEKKVFNDENPNDGSPAILEPAVSKGEYPTLVELSEKEQKSSAAWKWAISENKRLQGYESKYYALEALIIAFTRLLKYSRQKIAIIRY